jgi:hypothetical protein
MHALRLSLVGTVILALLGGLGNVAVGQDDEDAPVWVKLLTQENLRLEGFTGSYTPGEGFAKTVRDFPVAWDSTYSDARLDGMRHLLANEDCYEDGICVAWGAVEVTGPEGTTWSGWWHEIDDHPKDNTSFHVVLTGTGPYEGLTAILFSRGVWEQFPDAEYGVIYRGDPPEVISDPIKVVAAKYDAGAGHMVVPTLQVVSASEVGPDVLTDPAQVKGRRAAVDIAAGTVITPDLLEPPPDE